MYNSGACLVAAAVASRAPSPADVADQVGSSGRSKREHEQAAPLITANIGDSRAVLGLLFEGEVLPYEMSKQHNASNVVEVLRLQAEFPAAALGADVVLNKEDADDPRVCGIVQVCRPLCLPHPLSRCVPHRDSRRLSQCLLLCPPRRLTLCLPLCLPGDALHRRLVPQGRHVWG
jgi:hypothetical protein